MAVLTVEDLMPWWVAAGLDEHPGEGGTVELEVPDWLLEAPLPAEEPQCDCGRDVCAEPPAAEPLRWAVPGVWGDEPLPVVPTVGGLVTQLASFAAQVAAVDPASLAPDQALGEAEVLAQVQHQLRLVQLGRTADVRARALYEHLGYRNLAAWQNTIAPDAPSSDRTLSRRLPAQPCLAAALAQRRVSFTAARMVDAALAKVRPHVDRPDGLIDGLPGEEVVEASVRNVVDLVCRDRFGLEDSWRVDRARPAFWRCSPRRSTASSPPVARSSSGSRRRWCCWPSRSSPRHCPLRWSSSSSPYSL